MIRRVQVHRDAAGLGDHRAELGETQAAQQRDDAAREPAQQRQPEAETGPLQNVGAEIEDAAADHDAAEDADAAEQRDLALEFRLFGTELRNEILIVRHFLFFPLFY